MINQAHPRGFIIISELTGRNSLLEDMPFLSPCCGVEVHIRTLKCPGNTIIICRGLALQCSSVASIEGNSGKLLKQYSQLDL